MPRRRERANDMNDLSTEFSVAVDCTAVHFSYYCLQTKGMLAIL